MTGLFRLEKEFDDGFHVAGIGRRAQRLWRRIGELADDLAATDLGRQFDQHGTRLPRPQIVKRPAHQFENAAGFADLRRPFGHGAKILHRIEGWRRKTPADAIAGNEQHRDIVAEDLGGAGKRVLDAGSALHRKHAGALAVGRAADAVGNADADALLTAHDRRDADRGAGVDQCLARIANEMFYSLGLKNTCDSLGNFHVATPSGVINALNGFATDAALFRSLDGGSRWRCKMRLLLQSRPLLGRQTATDRIELAQEDFSQKGHSGIGGG